MFNGVYHNPNDYWRKDLKPHEYDKILSLSKRFLWTLVIICFMILGCIAFCSCKAKRPLINERCEVSDTVRVEYREKIVKVPVTVYVEVPVERQMQMSNDSSHLETSFAVSDARMIWINGVPFLRHSLENKPQRIARTDSVPVVEKEKIMWKTRRVTYTKTEIREKQNTWWEKVKILLGGWSLLLNIILISIAVWKRKSVFTLFI